MWRKEWVKWVVFALAATLIGLFFSSQIYLITSLGRKPFTWQRAIAATLPDWYVWAIFSLLIFRLSNRYPFGRSTWRLSFLVHVPVSLVIAALHIVICVSIIPIFQPVEPLPEGWWLKSVKYNMFDLFHWNVLVYWAIVSGQHALHYYRSFREKEIRASLLETQLARAQLEALKMQLHPHFLFNTLHSISSLLHTNPGTADKMITRLGDFLRITLENSGTQEVSLQKEMEYIECYLEIERIRFRDRLQVQLKIDSEALDAMVPNLVWQPVLENAIRHGIAPRSEPGSIEINARRQNGWLRLSIKDDGPGLQGSISRGDHSMEGVGLANTRARLTQLYGTHHSFHLRNRQEGGLEVILEIPFRREGTVTGSGTVQSGDH